MSNPPLRGLLIDIDGVLRVGDQPIPGAGEAIEALRRREVPFRFLTNVTRKSRAEEAERLRRMGILVSPEEIYTASAVTAAYLRRLGAPRCWLLLEGSGVQEFAGIPLSDDSPQYVVLGDLGDDFPVMLLHRAFRALLNGARLIAIQRNPSWTAEDGLPRLDVGAWCAALEYASGQPALVMGKPAPLAYQLPAEEMGIPCQELAMVSDDPDVDLAGARGAGLRTIFVRTTSLPRRRMPDAGEVDYVLNSIAELPALWDVIGAPAVPR